MTMATINLLLGIISIFLAFAVALGALSYALEGVRTVRRWNLVIAAVLADFAWNMWKNIRQDFARASDPNLLSHPADVGGMTAVAVWTLIGVLILTGDIGYLRSLRCPAL